MTGRHADHYPHPENRDEDNDQRVDLSSMTAVDTLIIILIAIIGVGGAKLVYAYLADRASVLFKDSSALRSLNRLAASIMIAVGIALLVKTQQWI